VLASVGTAAILTHGFRDRPAPTSTATVQQIGSGNAAVKAPVGEGKAINWAAVAEAVQPAVVAIQVSAQFSGAEGSGVIINAAEGQIVTNNHVISDAQEIQVALRDGRLYKARVLGTDPLTDLAVIKLEDPPEDLQEAELGDSDSVVVGQDVMAVGNPLGYSNTVTTGIVSAVNRPVSTSLTGMSSDMAVLNVIQVDAAINPGNSGGPLFDADGRVVGINSSIATLGATESGAGSIGLGFAIPSNVVKTVAPQLIEDGKARHALLGVTLKTTTVTFDGETRQGVEVDSVSPGEAAEAAGLKAGDVIIAIDGHPTPENASLQAWVRSMVPGQEINLLVVRDSKPMDIKATLGAQDTAAAAPNEMPGEDPNQGPEQPTDPYDQWGGGGFLDPFFNSR
jgi:putative serine protease PepD